MTSIPSGDTTWHITFGTYGTRLHGDDRPTVDRLHNIRGTPFLDADPRRSLLARERMSAPPLLLTAEQREFIESILPMICARGRWKLKAAAARDNHVHVLCDVPKAVHGDRVRQWMKRWLGEALSDRFGAPAVRWWAVGGSSKPVKNEAYRRAAQQYVERQRVTK